MTSYLILVSTFWFSLNLADIQIYPSFIETRSQPIKRSSLDLNAISSFDSVVSFYNFDFDIIVLQNRYSIHVVFLNYLIFKKKRSINRFMQPSNIIVTSSLPKSNNTTVGLVFFRECLQVNSLFIFVEEYRKAHENIPTYDLLFS